MEQVNRHRTRVTFPEWERLGLQGDEFLVVYVEMEYPNNTPDVSHAHFVSCTSFENCIPARVAGGSGCQSRRQRGN